MTRKTASGSSRGAKREIVIAPPGCGKTDELAKRLVRAVRRKPQQSVLCITFTKNAAEEMKRRAMKALHGKTLPDCQRICTLHSYCWEKLRDETRDSRQRLRVIDNSYLLEFSFTSGLEAFNRSLDYEGKEDPEIRLEQVVRAASHVTQGKEIPFESWRKKAWQEKFRGFIDKYLQFKDDLNGRSGQYRYLDFNDILLEADRKITSGEWTERFDVVLVDEVQDLSDFQLDIIERLVDDNGSICFFGDPEQAIYSFMGANVRKLHSLWLSCDGRNRHSSRINYRTPAYLLRIINKYAHNRIRLDRMWPGFNMEWEQIPSEEMAGVPVPDYGGLPLTHDKDLDEDIALYHASSPRQEVWRIGQLIDSFDPGESNAILALHNRKVDEVVALLKQKGKYVILGANEDEHTYLPRLMRAFIHLCRYPERGSGGSQDAPSGRDEEDPWAGMLPFLVRGKGKRWASGIIRALDSRGLTPLDIIHGRLTSSSEGDALLKGGNLQPVRRALLRFGPLFLDCRRRLVRLGDCPEEDLNTQLGNWIAYCHKHLVGFGFLVPYQIAQWDTILRRIKKELRHAAPEGLDGRLDIADGVLSGIRPEDLIPSYGPDRKRVHVMTVHKAKGLEFDNVFMCSANRTWDYSRSAEADRIFFVGITRARKRLVISYSDPAPTQEDYANGRRPKARLKDFSLIREPEQDA